MPLRLVDDVFFCRILMSSSAIHNRSNANTTRIPQSNLPLAFRCRREEEEEEKKTFTLTHTLNIYIEIRKAAQQLSPVVSFGADGVSVTFVKCLTRARRHRRPNQKRMEQRTNRIVNNRNCPVAPTAAAILYRIDI